MRTADLALQAAALRAWHHRESNFIDRNKRTALVAMVTFLEINGFRVNASDRELADWSIRPWTPRPQREGGLLGCYNGPLTGRQIHQATEISVHSWSTSICGFPGGQRARRVVLSSGKDA
jgi:hypothetical protein